MPVRWVTQFLSSRQTSSPTAHHRARRARQDVSSSHGIAEVEEPRFQSRIVAVPESVAKMPTITLKYRRPDDATRRSTPPGVSSDRQPLGTIGSGVAITIDSDNCDSNCSALERRREDYRNWMNCKRAIRSCWPLVNRWAFAFKIPQPAILSIKEI